MARPSTVIALMLLGLALADTAQAAGGAHVIDDAAVETPGVCHFENWVSVGNRSDRLLDIGPACTRKDRPNMEFGGFIAHALVHGAGDTTIGVTPKFVLRNETSGIGIGVSVSVGFGIDGHRFENAGAVVPVTIPVSPSVRLNINSGWQRHRDGSASRLFGCETAPKRDPTRFQLSTFNCSGVFSCAGS